MSAITQSLANHGAMLLSGATALLLAGGFAVALLRSPVLRQRICELSLVATLAWVVLASIPMPRVGWERGDDASNVVSNAPTGNSEAMTIPAELIAKPQAANAAKPSSAAVAPARTLTGNQIDFKSLL